MQTNQQFRHLRLECSDLHLCPWFRPSRETLSLSHIYRYTSFASLSLSHSLSLNPPSVTHTLAWLTLFLSLSLGGDAGRARPRSPPQPQTLGLLHHFAPRVRLLCVTCRQRHRRYLSIGRPVCMHEDMGRCTQTHARPHTRT